MKENILLKFAHEVTEDLHDFEICEMAVPNIPRDETVVIWVLKCLANSKYELGGQVLEAIIERRRSLSL